MERSRIKLLFLNVFRGIKRVQGADNHLFCHCAGKQAHGCLPVVFLHANRFEDRGNDAADGGKGRVINVVRGLTAQGETVQGAQENADHHNHLTGTQNEALQALPGLNDQAFEMRNVINRQFHHERRRFATHDGVLQHQAGENSHHDTQHIQGEDGQRPFLTKERRGKDREDRQSRAAGHERRHHDGHQAFARGIQRTRAHD